MFVNSGLYESLDMDVSKNGGTRGGPPQIIHFNRLFHYVHHPFWGCSPYFVETTISKKIHVMFSKAFARGLGVCAFGILKITPNGFDEGFFLQNLATRSRHLELTLTAIAKAVGNSKIAMEKTMDAEKMSKNGLL